MRALSYAEARLQIQPGDALLTAEPGVGAGFIRLFTGDAWSHIAAGAERRSDHTGRLRARVVQSNAGLGVHLLPTSRWLEKLRGQALWIRTNLTDGQRQRFAEAIDRWLGMDYEDVRGFVCAGLGLPSDDERADDHDLICSALFAALWREATGERIPGRPWFRLAPRRSGHVYVPTPGACLDYLRLRGGEPVQLVREERPLTSRDAFP